MFNRSGGGGRRPMGGHSGGGAVGLLGSSPDKRHQGQMGAGMQRMLGNAGRVGLLGNSPSRTRDNNMYGQQQQQQYDQGYEDNYEGGYRGNDDSSMYRQQQDRFDQSSSRHSGFDQSSSRQGGFDQPTSRQGGFDQPNSRQGGFDQSNSRQGGMNRGNARSGLLGQGNSQGGRPQSMQQQGYYDDQDYGGQDYTGDQGRENWGSNEDWDYGQDQQSRGDGLLEPPRPQLSSLIGMGGNNNRNVGSPRGRGILGQPSTGRGRGLLSQPMRVGQMNQGHPQHGMIDRQTELIMQKADLQIRLLQEEQREAEKRQQEFKELQRTKEMQTLLAHQQRALLMQQSERMGDGILGDRPGGRGLQGGRGIPSLFDGSRGGRTQLGKRPNATIIRAAQVAKRARQESQTNRNRASINPRRHSPKRGQKDRDGPRRSHTGSSTRSKSRDRKDSESRRSGNNSGGGSNKDHNRSRPRDSNDGKVAKEMTLDLTIGEEKAETEPVGQKEDVVVMEVDEPNTETKEGTDKPPESSLTVTVSKKGRSVNDSDSKGEVVDDQDKEKKYKCNVCDVKCYDERSFSRHMNGVKHKKKMEVLTQNTTQTCPILAARKKAEEHLRQIEAKKTTTVGKPLSGKAMESHCKVCNEMFTGAYKDHKEVPKHKAKEDRSKAGCKTCKVQSFNTYQDFIKHLDSEWHKKKQKEASWPECKICNQKFKSPRKFVLHCKTDHHIENKKKRGEEEDDFEDLGELVTLDTVGFEEDNNSDVKKEDPVKEASSVPTVSQPVKVEDAKEKKEREPAVKKEEEEEELLQDYNPNVAVGQKYVVPVSGFFCKLCHKFYNNESAARGTHCQSQSHFEKYQKIVIAKMMNKQTNKEAVSKTVDTKGGTTNQSGIQSSSAKQDPAAMETEASTTSTPLTSDQDMYKSSSAVNPGQNKQSVVELSSNAAGNPSQNEQFINRGEHCGTVEVEAEENGKEGIHDASEDMDTSELDENEIHIEITPGSMDSKGGTPKARRGRRPKKRV